MGFAILLLVILPFISGKTLGSKKQASYIDKDTKEVLDHFGLDWRKLEAKYALPEEIQELIRAKAGQQLAEMEASRKLDDERMSMQVQAAYKKDMDKALANVKLVQDAGRRRLAKDGLQEAEWELDLVKRATEMKKRIGAVAKRVQDQEIEVQNEGLGLQETAAKIKAIKDAGAEEMLALASDAETLKVAANVKKGRELLDRDVTEPLKWMAKEQQFVAKEAHYAESLWWKNHDHLKQVEKKKIHDMRKWLAKAHIGTPLGDEE